MSTEVCCDGQMSEKKSNQTNDAGFTLIELLIVVVVLGVLAAVVVISVGNVQAFAWVSDCMTDGANVNIAIQDYVTENGHYPTSVPVLLLPNPANGAPFIGSWPNQTAHYTFTLSAANDGTFVVSTPANSTGLLWTGAKTCTDPRLQLK